MHDIKFYTTCLAEYQAYYLLVNARRRDPHEYSKGVALYEKYKDVFESQKTVFPLSDSIVHFHDAYVRNLKEKRTVKGYETTWDTQAFVYDLDGKEHDARLPVAFKFNSASGMRALNNREIYMFILDTSANILSVLFWEGRRGLGQKLQSLVIAFDDVNITY